MVPNQKHPPGPPMTLGGLLEMARRHVTEGRQVVTRQREIIEWLKAQGRSTTNAERTLELFEGSLTIFEEHLHVIEAESKPDGR